MPPATDRELETCRRELDRIDAAIVELLAERMAVVAEVARIKRAAAADGPAIRPGREAVILRRLVERAAGRFPGPALVRMWRELLAATTRAQAPLAVVAWLPRDRAGLWDLARDHFGSATPIERMEDATEALRLVAGNPSCLAVLPAPEAGGSWWPGLLADGADGLRIVARLPFVRSEIEPEAAVVVAAFPSDASGDDLGLLALAEEADDATLVARLLALGLPARPLARAATATGEALRLVEVAGLVPEDDARLAAARAHGLRIWSLGGYARPLIAPG
ncbi:MAG: chorismate mutase [Geminicoccaceae bacterium]